MLAGNLDLLANLDHVILELGIRLAKTVQRDIELLGDLGKIVTTLDDVGRRLGSGGSRGRRGHRRLNRLDLGPLGLDRLDFLDNLDLFNRRDVIGDDDNDFGFLLLNRRRNLRFILNLDALAPVVGILTTRERRNRGNAEHQTDLVHHLCCPSFLTRSAKTSPRSPKLLN